MLDDLYCRYSFHFGPDWNVIAVTCSCFLFISFRNEAMQGVEAGLSQTSKISHTYGIQGVVWNFPIDITFKSTNAYGWPRLAISVSI